MDPGELAGDPEPGLVEVRHLGGLQRGDDRRQRRRDKPGGPPGHRRDSAGRGRDAEQLAQRLAGAVPGQELPVPQIRADPGDPRPVLHRRGHPVRRLPAGDRPAAAPAGNHLMPGDLRPDRRHVDHLPPLGPGLFRAGQAPRRSRRSSAARAGSRGRADRPAPGSCPAGLPAGQACGRSSCAATSAPAYLARPRTAAGTSSSNWTAPAPSARRPALAGPLPACATPRSARPVLPAAAAACRWRHAALPAHRAHGAYRAHAALHQSRLRVIKTTRRAGLEDQETPAAKGRYRDLSSYGMASSHSVTDALRGMSCSRPTRST